jgi:hypothetical protein
MCSSGDNLLNIFYEVVKKERKKEGKGERKKERKKERRPRRQPNLNTRRYTGILLIICPPSFSKNTLHCICGFLGISV